MRRRQSQAIFEPFVGFNPYRQGAGPSPTFVVALQVGDGYFCVEFQLGISQVIVFSAKVSDFPGRYQKLDAPLGEHVRTLTKLAKEHGATLEAIQLLGVLTPLTKEDENTMATTKLSRKDGDKEGLKAAAKTAPVGGKAAAAPKAPTIRKGNADALKKARESKGPAPDRAYKVLKKENAGREGSWTQFMIETIQAHTSTDDAKAACAKSKEFGDKKLDFGWAEKQGYIKLS